MHARVVAEASSFCNGTFSVLMSSRSAARRAGLEVLTAMEKVEVDEEDRPRQPITITGATVFVNPFKDEEAAEKKAAEAARLKVCLLAP